MSMEMKIIYDSGEREIPLATLRRAGNRIVCQVRDDISTMPFSPDRLAEIIDKLIELPLRVSRLRHKTMPKVFDEVEPGSREHFELLRRRCGPFRIQA